MPFTPDAPFPKQPGDTIRSEDWNEALSELQALSARLETDVDIAGDLGVAGTLHFTGGARTLFHFGTNASGTPSSDGIRFRYEGGYFGNLLDALIIEKTDFNQANPDGGIAFVNTGSDGTPELAMAIRGNGRVGIGVAAPDSALHVAGSGNSGANAGGALHVQAEGRNLRIDGNEINCDAILHLNYWSQAQVRVRNNLRVGGNLQVFGSKSGFVVDRFVNRSGEAVERGDVVMLGRPTEIRYGIDDMIPVPEVDLARQDYDRRVCGIVAELGVDATPPADKPEPETPASQRFAANEIAELDRTRVGPDQLGEMVTLGCYAECKVDADLAPIEVGDLLTTSTTPGHARKVEDPAKAIGAIVGKALAPLAKGKGKIPVMVTMQ